MSVAPAPGQVAAHDEAQRRLRLAVTGGLMLTVVLAGLFLAALESVVSRVGIEQLDAPVSRFVAAHRSPTLVTAARVLTNLGSPGVTIALAVVAVAVLFWRLRWLEAAAFLAISVAGGDLSYFVLKHVVRRARPPGALVHISSYSFPSGHAVGAFTLFLGLAWVLSRGPVRRPAKLAGWAMATAIVVVVGLTRIVLGVHYTSDVIGGFAVGALWVAGLATAWGAWQLTGRHLGPAGKAHHINP